MTRSAFLIFNPAAGQGDAETDLAFIKSQLEPVFDLGVHETQPDTDASELAHLAIEQGAEVIIASGGDGTVSAAAAAVIGSGIPFGVLPRGTANAFANALKIPTGLAQACETLLDGMEYTVDVATCNGKPMLLLAGIGFEAEVVKLADRQSKDRFGLLAYVLGGVRELRNLEKFHAEIDTDENLVEVTAVAITVANAAPPSSILAQGPAQVVADDGLLDVTIVSAEGMTNAIASAYDLFRSALNGDAASHRDIGYLQSRSITIRTEPPQPIVLDGELIGETPVEIKCIPQGLTVIVPQQSGKPASERLEGLPDLKVTPKLKAPEAEENQD